MVLATQNPVEYEGPTRSRRPSSTASWCACRSATRLRRRGRDALRHAAATACWTSSPSARSRRSRRSQQAAVAVHTSEPLRDYVVAVLAQTRDDPRVQLGASPRAGLMLLKAAKASAVLDGRDHALPDDVKRLAAWCSRTDWCSPRPPPACGASRRSATPSRWYGPCGRARDCAAGARSCAGAAPLATAVLLIPGIAALLVAVIGAGPGRGARRRRPRLRPTPPIEEGEPFHLTVEITRGVFPFPGRALLRWPEGTTRRFRRGTRELTLDGLRATRPSRHSVPRPCSTGRSAGASPHASSPASEREAARAPVCAARSPRAHWTRPVSAAVRGPTRHAGGLLAAQPRAGLAGDPDRSARRWRVRAS